MSSLEKAIQLTNEILNLLEDQDFDKVSELELERQPLIQQAFSDTVEKIDLIKAGYLQKLNLQVVDRLVELKQSVLQQQQHVRKASRATREYAKNQMANSGMLVSG